MADGFVGTFDHNLDGKGRVIIPVCFRERLGDRFTIAMNSEWTALALYPTGKWAAITERLGRIRETDAKAMAYKRLITANASFVDELDAQGRVVLPKTLRLQAGLERDIFFIGMDDYIEIWDAERYVDQQNANLGNMGDLLQHMDEHY